MSCWFLLIPFLLLLADNVLSDNCGQRTAPTQLMISHGNQSHLGEWPWHTAVLHRKNRTSASYACGGTIINSRHILTAAHCTYSGNQRLQPSKILVLVGISHLHKSKNSQQMAVAQITTHKDHSDVGECDIALLKLELELEFTSYVKPICLWINRADEELIVDKVGYVPGWGKNERGRIPFQLQHAAMQIVSRENCKNSDPDYYTRYLFDRKSFCAGFRNGTSPGLGDSGGGLYIEMGGKWILRGIVSNGKYNSAIQQLDTSSYIVFTDVAYFVPWVNSQIGLRTFEIYQELKDYSTCGKKKEKQFSPRRFMEERIWPWQGDVYRNGEKATWLCQTAIINKNILLSPAEVFSDEELLDPLWIVAVFRSYQYGVEHVIDHKQIQKINVHPKFDRVSSMHNLALLKLMTPLKFSELINPICLWKGETNPNTTGYTGEFQVNIYDFNTCVDRFHLGKSMRGNHSLCFYMLWNGIQIPALLYVKHGDTWYIRGVSLKKASRMNSLVVFALDIAHDTNWIEENADVAPPNLLNLQSCQNDNFSWLYEIWVSQIFVCFTSLITPTLFLTTASCVNSKPVKDILIWQNRSRWAEANKTYLHPKFDKMNFTNNIAVVQVKSKLDEPPICLPVSSTPLSSLELKILYQDSSETPTDARKLHSNNIIRTDPNTCENMWKRKKHRILTDGHICGRMEFFQEDRNFKCWSYFQAASLFYHSGRSVFLRGLLDVGRINHCDPNGLPEVFVDLTFYSDWLKFFAQGTTEAVNGD